MIVIFFFMHRQIEKYLQILSSLYGRPLFEISNNISFDFYVNLFEIVFHIFYLYIILFDTYKCFFKLDILAQGIYSNIGS